MFVVVVSVAVVVDVNAVVVNVLVGVVVNVVVVFKVVDCCKQSLTWL